MAAVPRLKDVPWEALEPLAERVCAAIELVLGGEPAERVVERTLREGKLDAKQRQAVAEAIFGVGLWRRRLGKAPAREMLWTLMVDLGGVEPGRAGALLGASGPDRTERELSFAERHSLPDWLEGEIRAAYGEEAEAFAEALNQPGPVCLRANRLRIDRDRLAEQLRSEGVESRPCALARDGLIVTSPRPNILGLASHRAALFEVQDEGSQLLGALVEAKPGETVLDFCAGAGGKTLLLAAAMENRGTLYAFDVDRPRLERLGHRAERAGVSCLSVLWDPPSDLRVDRVLVDAPCSELGVLRRGPDVRWRIDPRTFGELGQLDILLRAAGHVRSGGRLVYATCTFRAAENEQVVEAFLRQRPEFRLESTSRWAPHREGTDAFFGAVLTLR